MIFTSPEGHKIHYIFTHKANKTTIVFCNGVGQSNEYWNGITEALNDKYNVLLFDFPNQGLSSHSKKVLSTNDYAKVLIDLCGHLQISTCIGVGNAFGGLVIKLAYKSQPLLFKKIVLISCFAQRNKRMSRYAENTKSIVESIVNEQDFLKMFGQDWLEKSFLEMFGSEYVSSKNNQKKSDRYFKGVLSMMNSLQQSESNLISDIHKIKVPVLVIQGSLDQIIPPGNGSELLKALSKGTYKEIKNGSHILQESHPEELATCIDTFLNKA